ncbi:MAG TPA: hypothetical protein VJZ91_09680 [Blastocatellia bacterium]|nr:hypothetical protein [Blastocatellia bacterium]
MAELASSANPSASAQSRPPASDRPRRTYPVSQSARPRAKTSPFNAILLLVILSLLGGLLAMFARGGMEHWQFIGGSLGGIITLFFFLQVAAALLCFAFLIRWMRS